MSERVRVGDVFEDLDPRMVRGDITGKRPGAWPRRFKVIGIDEATFWMGWPRWVVVDLDTGRHARIEEDRLLQGGAHGYRKVEETAP